MSKNIVFCGVGGQGTVLASKLVAKAAMKEHLHVRTAETIGMAQRGGSVFSHMRLGPASSPLIGKGQADLLIGFEPGEAVRQLPYLKEGGWVVASTRPLQPVSAMIGLSSYDAGRMVEYLEEKTDHLVLVDADKALEQVGSPKVLNLLLLGAALRTGEIGVSRESLVEAIHETLAPKLWELNEKALDYYRDKDI